jgi:phospholipid-transporting ATPase
MYAYYGDVIWGNGREGGYLVLGNMVYTVSNNVSKN